KTNPSNGATQQDPSLVTLTWQPSAGATSYEVCVDTTNDASCSGTWMTTTSPSLDVAPELSFTPFFWQVRARNAAGTTDADSGTWWTFTTGTHTNVAAAANGGTTTASSVYGAGYGASGAIDGDRKGLNCGNGGGCKDGRPETHPDWFKAAV